MFAGDASIETPHETMRPPCITFMKSVKYPQMFIIDNNKIREEKPPAHNTFDAFSQCKVKNLEETMVIQVDALSYRHPTYPSGNG